MTLIKEVEYRDGKGSETWNRSVMAASPELFTKNSANEQGTMTSYTKLQLHLPNCKHKDFNLPDHWAQADRRIVITQETHEAQKDVREHAQSKRKNIKTAKRKFHYKLIKIN